MDFLSLLVRELGWLFWLTVGLASATFLASIAWLSAFSAWLFSRASHHRAEARLLGLLEMEENPTEALRALRGTRDIRIILEGTGSVGVELPRNSVADQETVTDPKSNGKPSWRLRTLLFRVAVGGLAVLGLAALTLC